MKNTEFTVKAGDVTLQARIAGYRETQNSLIAIHGGPGNTSNYMLGLESLQGDGLSVVTYDQRGTGRSTHPSEGFALLKYVEDLNTVRESAGVEKVHLFGHSWGGIVAMRYATVYPQSVKSIILFGSGPPSAETASAAQANLGKRIAALQRQAIIPRKLPADPQELMRAILPAYFSDPGFSMPDELEQLSYSQDISTRTYAALGV